MPRRPPRVLVTASAVLLTAVVGLWVRSYWRADALYHYGDTGANYGLVSSSGSLMWVWWWEPPWRLHGGLEAGRRRRPEQA